MRVHTMLVVVHVCECGGRGTWRGGRAIGFDHEQ